MAEDTVLFGAKSLDRLLRGEVEVVGAKAHHLAPQGFKGMAQEKQLAGGIHVAPLAALSIPRVSNLHALDLGDDVVISGASHNETAFQFPNCPREHVASLLAGEGLFDVRLSGLGAGDAGEPKLPKLPIRGSVAQVGSVGEFQGLEPHAVTFEDDGSGGNQGGEFTTRREGWGSPSQELRRTGMRWMHWMRCGRGWWCQLTWHASNMRGAWLAVILVVLAGCGAGKSEVKQVEGRPDIATIQAGDPEMEAAVARAKKELPDFISHFQKPDKDMDGFIIKKAFPHGDSSELMWIEVEKYENGVFHGTLHDTPEYVTSVKQGDALDVPEAEVIDWAIYRNGKFAVGGYTNEVLQRRMESQGK